MDLAIFGLHLAGVSSLLGSMNLNLSFFFLFVKYKKNPISSKLIKKCYFSSNKPKSEFNNNENNNIQENGTPKGNNKPKFDFSFVSGFVDAEGCFFVSISKNALLKCGYTVKPVFQISLHEKDRNLLYDIQNILGGIGKVYNRGTNACIFMVFTIEELIKLIEHFDKYPLLTCKRADFELFKSILDLIIKKEHLTEKGIKKIIALKSSLNKGLPVKLQESFLENIPVLRPEVNLMNNYLNSSWVAGFTEGEGCFSVVIFKSNTKTGFAVRLAFTLTQHYRDVKLINSLIKFFNCGQVNISKDKTSVCFKVTNLPDIYNIIMPFFIKHPLVGGKSLDFVNWCKIAELMKNKTHLTPEGLAEIQKIKSQMNKARLIDNKDTTSNL